MFRRSRLKRLNRSPLPAERSEVRRAAHGGIYAFSVLITVAMMTGADSIRDDRVFRKTQRAQVLVSRIAPPVTEKRRANCTSACATSIITTSSI